ncbi:MAG: hypothetical protein J6X60_11295 [Ruminiclostridium sp.]|nr:hypothetical protein [Ruminiclostridium sp.]
MNTDMMTTTATAVQYTGAYVYGLVTFREQIPSDGQQVHFSPGEELRRQYEELEQKKAEKELMRRQQQEQKAQENEAAVKRLEEEVKAAKKHAEAIEEEFKAFANCMKIASRISRGDIVPGKDIKYLMEHEPDLYKQAIMLRMPNPKPKKYDSVLDEEEEHTEEAAADAQPDSDSISGAQAASGEDAGAGSESGAQDAPADGHSERS